MAYSTSNPPALVSQRVGASGGALWILKTTEDLAAVTVDGYISNAVELGMVEGDKLIHIDSTNGVVNDLLVGDGNTAGTASGALCSAIEPVGETSIALDSAGTGTILVGDIIMFSNDPDTKYRVTTGDTDVSNGGTIVITPALVTATAVGTAIEVQTDVLTLRGNGKVKSVTADATLSLDANESGSTFLLAKADGIVFTLPAPVVGLEYEFLVTTAVTSNAYSIDTDAASTFLAGVVITGIGDAATTETSAADGTTIVSLDMNGSTKGGLIGSYVKVKCVSSTQWMVTGTLVGSGTLVSPFA